jgi:hypothetical protein
MDRVNLNLKQRKIFAKVRLSGKVRHKWQGGVAFFVVVCFFYIGVRKICKVLGKPRRLLVINRRPRWMVKDAKH